MAMPSTHAMSSTERIRFIETRGSFLLQTIASYCLAAIVATTTMAIAGPGDREGPAVASHDQAHLAEPIYWCAVHVSRGELSLAMPDCDQAVVQFPTHAEAYSNRGAVFFQFGNHAQALSDLNRAVELLPNDAMMHYNRGVVYSELKDPRAAIRDFSRAIDLNPSLVPAFHNRGREYEEIGERALAIADFERALALRPGFALSAKRLRILRGDL